jgi:hypothetical protein
MQHLINQAADFLQGNGNPTYGPVPLVPASAFISPQQTHNPDPYNPAQAVALLRAHGWHITPHGTDTCQHPGTTPADWAASYAYENYLAQQLPVLWMPQFDFQISAVSNTLRGVYPQDPLTNIYPENWYLVK